MELSRIVNESNDNSNNGNNNNNNNNDNNDTDALDNRILMKEIIKIAKDGKIEEVYHDVNKYFLFHRLCVMNVLFKTKWKKNRMTQKCFDYTDVSDDAFAFLILENNALRYIDMADEEKDSEDYSLPVYTDAVGKTGQENSRNLKGKGWSREGMIRFQKIQMQIEDLFENESDMMNTLSQLVLDKYRAMNANGCVEGVQYDQIETEQDKNKRDKEDQEWDDFLRRNAKRRRGGGIGAMASI
jgi:hypothetical protein